jgi:hypothetical protein
MVALIELDRDGSLMLMAHRSIMGASGVSGSRA